jgi:uncharacterized membrane protein YhfC
MYLVQVLLMLAAPIGLWLWLRRRWSVSWGLIVAGAVGFVASQVVHIPLLMASTAAAKHGLLGAPGPAMKAVLNAVLLGLYAGVCEEPARWAVMRFWQRQARDFRSAIALGAGHGGIEALLVGLAAAATLVGMLALRRMDLASLPVDAKTRALAVEQVRAYWAVPLYVPLLGGLERVGAIVVHLAASTLVMQCFARRRMWPLLAAIGWHTLVDGASVYVMGRFGLVAVEGLLVGFALAGAALIEWSRRCLQRI